ncbi:glutamate 5-kinase [Acinetobacter pittii]|uniref:glutamate 5-kinase n=1 Tax=Acinetobacter pittii TaxID=48296 RepID=UPI000A35F949|nr:glutamate 5-kinase [Acinetobacter pittii]AVN22487.1 glutamate 5-kinase [Acinetobacter pittii]OTT04050.1 glutamate 5-kinase [Acinetobacter pittii]PPC00236.1 glutamate 5-kinase [Acinetobacter pittii]PPC34496.1 glutamate 5-kinase [Acinetobacter pittii]WPP63971.1 glutamate 5-kinase [Acinetobacter pittii]
MGLRDEIQAEIAEAFDEDLADAVHTFTCERIVSTSWNPKTNTSENVVENYSGRGVLFGSYNQYEIQTLGVLATDNKAVILQNEVTMVPKIDDEWVTGLGTFRVIHIQQDPAATIWKCQLRRV